MTPETLTVKVPFTARRRGRRKLVLAPEVVEAILAGRQPEAMTLVRVRECSRWNGSGKTSLVTGSDDR